MIRADDVTGYLVGTRILLIDDSAPFQQLTAAMLKKKGIGSMAIASDLSEGMHYLNYYNDQAVSPEFDLVLMDVNLPDGNGIRGCEFVSMHAATHNIPVIVMSGRTDPDTIQQAFSAGASDYLTKPLSSALLGVRLGTLLKLKAVDCLLHKYEVSSALRKMPSLR